MARRSHKPAALREAWMLPPDDGSRGRFLRRVRRWFAVSVIGALALCFLYLLLAPFWHPTLHTHVLTGGRYDAFNLPPLDYAQEDLVEVTRAFSPGATIGDSPDAFAAFQLRSRDDLQRLEASLAKLSGGAQDIQIVYLSVHGLAVDGEPYLLLQDFDPAEPEAGRYPLRNLLDQLERSSAGAKLLVLDTGRVDYDPRLGMLASEFPKRVGESLRQRPKSSLWVCCSHAALERAVTIPAQRRSVFGHFMAEGLRGEADADRDRLLSLGELYSYVSREVGRYVRVATGGRLTQTPQIWRAGHDAVDLSQTPVLRAVGGIDLAAVSQVARKEAAASGVDPAKLRGATKAGKAKGDAGDSSGADGSAEASNSDSTDPSSPAKAKDAGDPANDSGGDEAPSSSAASDSSGKDGSPAAQGKEKAKPSGDSSKQGAGDRPSSGGTGTGAGGSGSDSNRTPRVPRRDQPRVRPSLPSSQLNAVDTLAAARAATLEFAARDESRELHPRNVAAPAWRAWRQRLRGWDALRRADELETIADLPATVRRDLQALLGATPSDPTETPAPGLQGFSALYELPSVASTLVPTWALAERANDEGGAALPAPLVTLADKLDRLLTDDANPLRELDAKNWPADAERYLEFRLARRWIVGSALPLAGQRSLWRAVRIGEQVAANRWASVAWIRGLVERADAQRLAGLRELHDQLGAGWRDRGAARLERAAAAYAEAERAVALANDAESLFDETLDRAADYLRWFHAAAGDSVVGPEYTDVATLLENLEQLANAFVDLDQVDAPTLANRLDQLRLSRQRVEAPLDPTALAAWLGSAGESLEGPWRADVLLRSELAPIELRVKLEELARRAVDVSRSAVEGDRAGNNAAQRDRRVAGGGGVVEKLVAADDWIPVARQLALEWRLARLLTPTDDTRDLDRLRAAVESVAPELLRGGTPGAWRGDEGANWNLVRDASNALAAIHGGVARQVVSRVERDSDLRNGDLRDERLEQLRTADRLARLIDPRDVARLEQINPARRLRQAAWYATLAWQRQRALAETADAPAEELAEALARAAICRRLAQELPLETPIEDRFAPPPLLDGASEVALVSEPRAEWTLRVRPAAGTASPVWLVLDYEPELIEVESADLPVYRQAEVAEKLGALAARGAIADAANYPVDPRLAELPPSWEITAGAPRDVKLAVRRKSTAGRPTRLIAKLVGRDFYVRHETAILLSTLDAVALVPSSFPGGWSQRESTVSLHPLPNQKTEYKFALVNQGDVERTVDVELLAPRQPLPSTAILTLPAKEALEAIGPTTLIGKATGVKLPAGGVAVPFVPAPPAGSEPAEQATSGVRLETNSVNGGAQDSAPPANSPPAAANNGASDESAEGANQPLAGTSLNDGLLVLVRDQATGQSTLRRVEIRPLRPRAFLTARVGYNLEEQRIEIVVTPRDKSVVPAKGLRIRCETPEPLPQGAEARLEGVLAAPRYEARLYIRAPADEPRTQLLSIGVDRYARAFFFRVPTGVASNGIPEADDVLGVRIIAPAPGKWFRAPVETIPVRVEVDAPRGAYDGDRDTLEIGLDVDRDRDFRGEQPRVFTTDRQAELATTGFAGPTLTIETRVGDFDFNLPTGGLRNVRSNLLARARAGAKSAWSLPVEVVLDAAPPTIRRVQLPVDPPITVGSEMQVVVAAVDGEMSGVESVEVGFDPRFEGKFGPGAAPVQATPTEPSVWIAKVPVQGIEPGPTQLLVRATDRAGNASEFTKVQLVVLPKAEEGDGKPKPKPGKIEGSARYGERLLAGADVTLEGDYDARTRTRPIIATKKAGSQGEFVFEELPPGKYRVKVRGLANNRPRLGAQEITVVSPPQRTPRADIKAK